MSGQDCDVSAYFIRFLVSSTEYPKLLRTLGQLSEKLPSEYKVKGSATTKGDFVQELVRTQTRLFGKATAVFFLINVLIKRRGGQPIKALRAGVSISAISGLYRALYHIFNKVAATLIGETPAIDSCQVSSSCVEQTQKLHRKRKLIARIIVPALSGLIAGTSYELFPNIAKSSIALEIAFRSVEYLYNYLDDEGYFDFKPRILGSWSLFPFAFAQLFHTMIMHPDCGPPLFERLMFKMSFGYIPQVPEGFPEGEAGQWPSARQTVDNLAIISQLKYPKFESPIMFPNSTTLPKELNNIEPVIGRAHPAMKTLTGALMHPSEPSEFRTYTEFILTNTGAVSKYVFALYAIFGLLRRKRTDSPLYSVLGSAVVKTIRTTLFIVMTSASAWSGVGLAQQLLSNRLMPVFRYRIIGFLAGLWAFVDQVDGHLRFTYTSRLALMSYWNVLVKQKHVKPIPHGEVALFSIGFALIMTLYDVAPKTIPGSRRKLLNWIKNHKYVDPVQHDKED